MIFEDQNGEMQGIFPEVLAAIAEKEYWELEYVQNSWAGNIEALKNGEIDLLVTMSYMKERDSFVDYSKEGILTTWGAVFVQPELEIGNILDLNNVTIGLLKNGIYGLNFKDLVEKFELECEYIEFEQYQDVYNCIKEGDCYAGVTSNIFGYSNAHKYGLIESPIVFTPRPMGFAVPEGKNADILSTIDETVNKWKLYDDSPYHQTIKKWYRPGVGEKVAIPSWMVWLLIFLVGLIVATSFTLWILRRMVNKRTHELWNSNKELNQLAKDRLSALDQLKVSEAKLEGYNEKLEEMVDERTKKLQEVNKELTDTLANLKETQSKLVQSEKMASLGILTSGISHEINNPLNFISGGVTALEDLLKKENLLDELTLKIIGYLKTGVDRIELIINGLKSLDKSDFSLDEQCDVHQIINNTLLILKNRLSDNITIATTFCRDSMVVSGNVGSLHQVFLSILINSIQSIEKKGAISISTKIIEDSAHISVSDNGIGIDDEHIQHLTDPFYTTMDPGEGVGLGLSIVYSIISKHNGSIEFDSKKE